MATAAGPWLPRPARRAAWGVVWLPILPGWLAYRTLRSDGTI